MFGEKSPIDPWLIIDTFQMGRRYQMNQIPISLQIPGKEQEMIVRIFSSWGRFLLKPVSWCDVDLAPHDRLNSLLLCLLIKLQRPIKISMISQRQCGLTQLLRTPHQLRNTTCPIQQGVFRMAVQMDKWLSHNLLI